MIYVDPFGDFKKCLAQAFTVVSVAEMGEAKEATLELPLCRCRFLNPMASDSEVSVSVASLPCVAGETNFASDRWTLEPMREQKLFSNRRLR